MCVCAISTLICCAFAHLSGHISMISIYLSSGPNEPAFKLIFRQRAYCCSCYCICCCRGLLSCPCGWHCQPLSPSPPSLFQSISLARPLFRRFVWWKVVVQLPFTFAASIFGFKSSLESFCDCYCTRLLSSFRPGQIVIDAQIELANG